jgi:GNAT superfamily N-acetyltransferase
MIIRDATVDDMEAMLKMGREFFETTYYAGVAPFCNDTATNLLNIILDTGVLKLALIDGEYCGMIGLVMFPFAFNAKVNSAHEVFWYTSPDARSLGLAKALLSSAEQACLSKGAVFIQMASLATSPDGVGKFYESLGYKLEESFYVKVV